MSIIILDTKERERFAFYLRQEAATSEGMADQMEKIKVSESMIKHIRRKVGVYNLIADELMRTEDMKI